MCAQFPEPYRQAARQWLDEYEPELGVIESSAEKTLDLTDEWEYRRLLEVYEQLDRVLLQRLADFGLASECVDVREAALDFRIS